MAERTHQRRDRSTGVKVLLNQHCTSWKINERAINWLIPNTHVAEGFGIGCKHCALKITSLYVGQRRCKTHPEDSAWPSLHHRAEKDRALLVFSSVNLPHFSHFPVWVRFFYLYAFSYPEITEQYCSGIVTEEKKSLIFHFFSLSKTAWRLLYI